MQISAVRFVNTRFSGQTDLRLTLSSADFTPEEWAKLQGTFKMQSPEVKRQRQEVIRQAKHYILRYQMKAQAKRLLSQSLGQTVREQQDVVLIDVDDTLLDGSEVTKDCMLKHQPWEPNLLKTNMLPAIPETLAFIHWLKKRHIGVYLVTGRTSDFEAATRHNLEQIGLSSQDYLGLFLRDKKAYPEDRRGAYKLDVKKQIAQTQMIIAEVGDQPSDFEGGYGKPFLLPNEMYRVH